MTFKLVLSDTSIFSIKAKPVNSIFINVLDVVIKVCLHKIQIMYKNCTPPSSAKLRYFLVLSCPLWILLD